MISRMLLLQMPPHLVGIRTMIYLALCILTFVTTGCMDQQDLCMDHEAHDRQPVNVVFDWSDYPDAAPSSMSLFLFPDDGRRSLRYEFPDREGGRIMVPPGTYTAIAINSETNGAKARNTEYLETFEIWLRDAFDTQTFTSGYFGVSPIMDYLSRAPEGDEERLASITDPMWRARYDGLRVTIYDTGVQTLEMHLDDAVCHYTVEIRNVTNLKRYGSMSGTLSGAAGSMFVHDGSVSGEAVTIPFDFEYVDDTTIRGQLLTIGHCGYGRARSDEAQKERKHHIAVFAALNDGTVWSKSHDVTAQIHESPTGNCEIIIDGLDLPENIQENTSGGMAPTIDEWGEPIYEDIPMGW